MAKGLRKTFKREMGVGSIVAVLVAAFYAMAGETAEIIAARAPIVAALALPAFAFAAGAFGMDWVAKQTDWGGSPYGSENYYGEPDRSLGPGMPPPPGTEM